MQWNSAPAFKIPIPPDEEQRLQALYRYDILDSPPEQNFTSITVLAAHVCHAPVALIVLVDRNRQWFKASVGVRLKETPREISFCAHTIMARDILMIPDARRDKRFAANPFVMGKPRFRFYAGAPLVTPDNRALGTLCVFDTKQRTLTTRQQTDLIALSRCIMTEMELRRTLMTERAQKKPAPRSQSAQRHSAGSRRA